MTYRERNAEHRDAFKIIIGILKKVLEITKVGGIVYIDESGMDHNEVKSRSWSPVRKPISSEQYGYRYKRTTLLAWVRWDVILAPLRFEGSTNTEIFNTWVAECLCPELSLWDIVVLDNASFHKSKQTQELIEKRGATLLFLPPVFSWFESYRKLLGTSEALCQKT